MNEAVLVSESSRSLRVAAGPKVAGKGELTLTSAHGDRVCGFRGARLVIGTAKKLALRPVKGVASEYGNGALFDGGRLWLYGEGVFGYSKNEGATATALPSLPRFASADPPGYVQSMAIDGSGTLFVLGIEGGHVSYFVVRTRDGKRLDRELLMHKTDLSTLFATPHGVFATAGDGLYRCDAAKLTRVLKVDDNLSGVCHTPNGTLVAVGPYAGVNVSRNKGKWFSTFVLPKGIRLSTVAALDDRTLVLGGNVGIYTFDLDTNELACLVPGYCRSVIACNGEVLAALRDGSVRVISIAPESRAPASRPRPKR